MRAHYPPAVPTQQYYSEVTQSAFASPEVEHPRHEPSHSAILPQRHTSTKYTASPASRTMRSIPQRMHRPRLSTIESIVPRQPGVGWWSRIRRSISNVPTNRILDVARCSGDTTSRNLTWSHPRGRPEATRDHQWCGTMTIDQRKISGAMRCQLCSTAAADGAGDEYRGTMCICCVTSASGCPRQLCVLSESRVLRGDGVNLA